MLVLPFLAQTFRELASHGKRGFYEGRIAEAIVELVQSHGGCMTMGDLQCHTNTFDEPIHVNYRGVDVWEIAPNGQGITALMALNILEQFDIKSMSHNSAEYLHLLIEAMRLSFSDTRYFVSDPDVVHVPIHELLSKQYAQLRKGLIKSESASEFEHGNPVNSSDTVYFTVVDPDGNACSFINSNYMGTCSGNSVYDSV